MPAVRGPILVEAGSFEPQYWTVTDPVTGTPIDLTASGFVVTGRVATKPDGTGVALLLLPDSLWRRTTSGRVYFQPGSAVTAAWTPAMSGFYQAELTHPSGQTVRFAEGRFIVDTRLV